MAHVPSWRPDIMGEADLVEEVARIASLTKLQGKPLPRVTDGIPKPVMTPAQRRQSMARRTCAALGYNEMRQLYVHRSSSGRFVRWR